MNNNRTDKGWQQMLLLLDREMPVKKRRKYPIIWFSASLAALGVIIMCLLIFCWYDISTQFPDSKTDEIMPAIQKADRNIETANSLNLPTQNNKLSHYSGKELTAINKSKFNQIKPKHTIGTDDAVENLKVLQSVQNLILNEYTLVHDIGTEPYRTDDTSAMIAISTSSGNDHRSSENITELQIQEKISKLPELLTEGINTLYPFDSDEMFTLLPFLNYDIKAVADMSLFNRWSAYAQAGAGSSKASLFGAGINYHFVQHDDRALAFSLGINLYRNNTQTAISLADAENAGIEPDQLFTTSWGPTTGIAQPVTLSLQNMAEIETGIYYHQKIYSRWFASGGISGVYRRHINAGGVQDRSVNNQFDALDSNSPVYNKLYHQYDLRPALGIGLRFHNRWCVSTRYTYGLIPVNKFAENASDKVFTRLWLLKMTFDL